MSYFSLLLQPPVRVLYPYPITCRLKSDSENRIVAKKLRFTAILSIIVPLFTKFQFRAKTGTIKSKKWPRLQNAQNRDYNKNASFPEMYIHVRTMYMMCMYYTQASSIVHTRHIHSLSQAGMVQTCLYTFMPGGEDSRLGCQWHWQMEKP